MSLQKDTTLTKKEIISGYKFIDEDGITKDIVLGRARGRPRKIRNKSYFPQDVKVDCCTLYAVYGNVDEVSKITKVPPETIRSWKNEPWWVEITKQVYVESNEGVTAKISNILDKTLDLLSDRLENGDSVLDNRTGKLVKKPVDTKVLASLFDHLAIQRRLGRNEPTSIRGNASTDERLKALSDAFEKFSAMKTINHIPEDIEDADIA